MLEPGQVDKVVSAAAVAALNERRVTKIYTSRSADSDGNEALDVTIVIRRGAGDEVDGDSALDAIVRIGRDLRAPGDDRQPITEFVTEEELEEADDLES